MRHVTFINERECRRTAALPAVPRVCGGKPPIAAADPIFSQIGSSAASPFPCADTLYDLADDDELLWRREGEEWDAAAAEDEEEGEGAEVQVMQLGEVVAAIQQAERLVQNCCHNCGHCWSCNLVGQGTEA